MEGIRRMFLENRAWAKSRVDSDPEFFKKTAETQTPTYLWIGCSDSRVHPAELTNTNPGEMFVSRNIANLVVHTDMNLLSVIEYAINVLKVPHVIICGHYNCGGVRAALSHQSLGLIDNWVRNIKDCYFNNQVEIDKIEDETDRVNRLVELNVVNQVRNLAHTAIIQQSWKNQHKPHIHGWVYDLSNGLLKEIVHLEPGSEIDPTHRYDF